MGAGAGVLVVEYAGGRAGGRGVFGVAGADEGDGGGGVRDKVNGLERGGLVGGWDCVEITERGSRGMWGVVCMSLWMGQLGPQC